MDIQDAICQHDYEAIKRPTRKKQVPMDACMWWTSCETLVSLGRTSVKTCWQRSSDHANYERAREDQNPTTRPCGRAETTGVSMSQAAGKCGDIAVESAVWGGICNPNARIPKAERRKPADETPGEIIMMHGATLSPSSSDGTLTTAQAVVFPAAVQQVPLPKQRLCVERPR